MLPPELRGLVCRIVAGWQVPMVLSATPRETARYIYSIARQEFHAAANPQKNRPRRARYRRLSTPHKILMQIPHVGFSRAQSLLERFSSIESICRAEDQAIIEVAGVGEKALLALRRALGEQRD